MTEPADTAPETREPTPDRAGRPARPGRPGRGRPVVAPPDATAVLAAIAAAEAVAAEARQSVDDGSEGGGRRANKGVWIRAAIYVIGFHVFAGFIMLLFFAGSPHH
ncbi:hypothetical protein GXW83_22440 [Streptacidiphilus sp. PB12-B1b]|uniref:DUF6126 family protein n=1 Tax=Streptacidiphilus sp. PB12-B1b TaxID=2705012 RepID=UPI0015F8BAC9|nr:DUF6126 family protein [Streptacidiphilus sp. PB12-B1b]QMU78046.1 hypothetical protein GXW83_22440 [Streptacidiphilus sp. PB12-B1b]